MQCMTAGGAGSGDGSESNIEWKGFADFGGMRDRADDEDERTIHVL